MYDFYFGTHAEIESDPKKYLLAIKRMLPRWCNSIPDSEFLAIYDILIDADLPDNPVFVETGSGASSIVLAYFALRKNGELYTWDINGSKLAYLRSVMNDTLLRHFTDKNLSNHWKYTAFASTSDFAGIGMLKELKKKVNFCFFDSEHTLDVLMKELTTTIELLDTTAVVSVDDGNYTYKHHNTAYINMVRKKFNLPEIADPAGNVCKCFWEEAENILKASFKKAEHIKDTYKETFQSDLFWSYYKTDREVITSLKMEKSDNLLHRFDAWKVSR